MATQQREPVKIAILRRQLLDWYARNRRDLPWRRNPDPYAIWVSEIMLQQTRVAVVVDRYQAFLATVSHVEFAGPSRKSRMFSLCGAAWATIVARACCTKPRNFVVNQLGGNLPASSEALRMLPGIGAYTAAAIASIAHGEAVAVVDGNVERVLCRLAGWEASSRKAALLLSAKIEALAAQLVDPAHPGDFNQAIMELGATVCLPRNPQCLVCPIAADCKTRGEHKTAPRPRMLSREVAHALSVRNRPQARNDSHGSAAGAAARFAHRDARLVGAARLARCGCPREELRMTVRHAIMQVNYYVRIRTVFEDEVEAMTVAWRRAALGSARARLAKWRSPAWRAKCSRVLICCPRQALEDHCSRSRIRDVL